ncbi:MAG: carboxypeptidase-like regulatory domain-containing protein [Bythopirellula sp.]|nr:carboxypeptidase-like regulatory domain-containing protein [Bythopirellula sp.]
MSSSAQEAAQFRYIEIKVLDEQAKPLVDAQIDVTMSGTEFPLTVDKEGIATLNLPGDAEFLLLKASVPGHIPLEVRWHQQQLPKDFTFTMSKGQPIGGFVHDERGKPIADVKVEGLLVSSHVGTDGEVYPVIGGELAKTDTQGQWQANMATSEPLEMRLKLTHKKYFSDVGFGKRRLADEELRSLKHVEVLEDRLPPQGTITTAAGKPAAEVAVYVAKSDEKLTLENGKMNGNSPGAYTVSDENGKYQIALQEGEFRVLCVAAEGWALVPGKRYAKNLPVDIKLTPWARLEGVLTKDEKPIPDEKLQLLVVDPKPPSGIKPITWNNTAITNEKGEFAFERLRNGYAILGGSVTYCDESDHRRQEFSNEAHVTLQPGSTAKLEFKRDGVTVSGTLVPLRYDGSEALMACGHVVLEREDEAGDIARNLFFEWGRAATVGINFDPVENAASLASLPKPSYPGFPR